MAASNNSKGPWPAKRLLSVILKERLLEEFLGDLEEVYEERLERKGVAYAKVMYWIDTCHLLAGFFSFSPFIFKKPNTMTKHYLTIFLRHVQRNKAYAFTNIVSLAIGMGVCLVIFQYVYFELSYDQFHDNSEKIYRVITKQKNGNSMETYPDALGYAFGEEAVQKIPEVVSYVRKQRVNRTATVTNPGNNQVFFEDVNKLFFVDPSFFDVFSFPLLSGNQATLFSDKYNMVITENAANKYFGKEDPIGKQLNISGPPSPGKYFITGVLKNPPANSHWQFDFLMPMGNYLEYGWGGAVKRNGSWGGFSVVTYFVIEKDANLKEVSDKLNALIAENTSISDAQKAAKEVILQPVKDVYLKSGNYSYPGYFNATGSLSNILVFTIVSLIIIAIAWINYINLATAQSIQRTREVGIRKSLGARRKQLIYQFVSESVFFNLISAGSALVIAYLTLPLLNQLVDKEINLSLLSIPLFWVVFITLVIFGSVLSGLYPAFVISSTRPVAILKGHTSKTKKVGLRQGLIVVQFLSSLILLSATYVLFKQTSFMQNQDLTVDLEKILVLQGPRVTESKEEAVQKFKTFRTELASHHSIEAVTGSLFTPGQFWNGSYKRLGTSEVHAARGFYTTLNFENTYDLEFIAGGPFKENMPDEEVIIINESGLTLFGFKNAEDAIGQKLIGEGGNRQETIIGVVKDFHWHSLHEGHSPYIISLYESRLTENISIKMGIKDLPETLEYIETAYQSFFPGNPLSYHFADRAFNEEYKAEERFIKLFSCFAILAIFIASVGLFALVSYSFGMRFKEIGIRKVLGAGVPGLMLLLSKEYLKLIGIAILLALPVVSYFGNQWLDNYAYRIPISWDLLMFPAVFLLMLTFATVGRKTFAATGNNPVHALRSE